MRKLIALCFFFFAASTIFAQQNECDSNAFSVFKKYKGQMVNITCDTMYLLNKVTFHLMYQTYNAYRHQNTLLNEYQVINEGISSLYELQLDTQRMYFDTLNVYFQKLAISADTLVNTSKKQLGTITQNLDVIESQVNQSKKNISDASSDIKEAKKQMRRQRIKYAIGGFTIGAGITLLATLIL
jgi:hypothetical protein